MFHSGRVGGTEPHRHHRHHHHHHHQPPPPPPPRPALFHLLQLTIISAQDLNPTCSKTRAYAEAWVDPDYKLQTRTDRTGRTNPSWNDKFIFRVDSDFLRSDTSAISIDIKRASLMGLRPDPVIGTARLVLSTVNPSPVTRFVAVQVRRPKSLRPQGILNLGVAVWSEMEAAGEMEKSGGVGRWVVDKERKALQLKLEKWRTEISPMDVDPQRKSLPERKEEAKERFFGCFCGGGGGRRRD